MAPSQAHPNILLIMTDHQRWDALGAAPNPAIRTPDLDRLAADGVLFETAITPCAVCAPARTALMTGLAPSRNHCTSNGHPLENQADTLPARLNRAGYFTQALGKMHFKARRDEHEWPWEVTYGFQDMVLSEETRWLRQARDRDHAALDDYDRYLLERGLWGWDLALGHEYSGIEPAVSRLPEEHSPTAWLGALTVDWLEHHRKEPFFLFTSFAKPHPPFDPPEPWAWMYDPHEMPLPVRQLAERQRMNPAYEQERLRRGWNLYSEEAECRARSFYYACVSQIDHEVGRILDALDRLGLRQDTHIIFTADHGEMLGDHWMWFKNLGYDGCTRVPLIVSGPGTPQGVRVRDSVVSTLDVFGTVLARAGVSLPTDRPSDDLLDYVHPQTPVRTDSAVMEVGKVGGRRWAIRTLDSLYVHWEDGGFEELYDLRQDPDQLHDLANDRSRSAAKAELQAAIVDWIHQWGDPAWDLGPDGDLLEHAFTGIQGRPELARETVKAAFLQAMTWPDLWTAAGDRRARWRESISEGAK